MRVVVTRRWRVAGAPDLLDQRGRQFRPTELVVTVVDAMVSTTAVHGLLRGTSGPHGARYTTVTWYGPWAVSALPEWIVDAVDATESSSTSGT
ncbi:hypothetical protein ACH4T9_20040 [Micromonospora sp. NPDC020750]|uniref:hypothetical protein n=1 Tax=unclassified Micromonospora TaxID=2617518 RepID=UPI00379CFDF9